MGGITTLVTYYDKAMSLGDERTKDWPLMKDAMPVFSITIMYLLFVKVIGPAWMKNREPFQLKKVIIIYNILMVGLSTHLFYNLGRLTYFGKYNWLCQPSSFAYTSEDFEFLNVVWLFLVSKIIELLDTAFFVMRKKYNQISTLHVLHHCVALWTVWFYFKFSPGGQNALFSVLNCFIHMVMYFYYFLSALGPAIQKYLWWKRYLTQLQMAQFAVAFVHGCIPVFYDCGYKPVFTIVLIFDGILFLVLFYDFYKTAYKKGKSKATPVERDTSFEKKNGYHKPGHQKFQNEIANYPREDNERDEKKSL